MDVGETIAFECTDPDKVPNDGSPEVEVTCVTGGWYDPPVWPDDPGCVKTCTNFPNVPQMKKVSSLPVLAERAIEYTCKNSKKVKQLLALVISHNFPFLEFCRSQKLASDFSSIALLTENS